MTRTHTIINKIYQLTHSLTSKIYSDESWEGVNSIINTIKEVVEFYNRKDDRNLEVVISVENGGYKTSKDGLNQWKEYNISIEENDNSIIAGVITCHAAGTVEYPFSKYDITIQLWKA